VFLMENKKLHSIFNKDCLENSFKLFIASFSNLW